MIFFFRWVISIIIRVKKKYQEATDGQIDALVYELYELTEEEIRLIDGTRSGQANAGRISNEGNLLALEDKRTGTIRAGGLRRQQSSGLGVSLQAF